MSEQFDAYHKWLGIPPKDQPPHHYRLLGLDPFESDPAVIEKIARRDIQQPENWEDGGPVWYPARGPQSIGA